MFSVDGLQWRIPCGIARTVEVTASEISGLMMDGTYFNDVIGTFIRYTVMLAVPLSMKNEYRQLHELLAEPVNGHSFTLPYNSGTISVTGRVERIADVYVRRANGDAHWKGIQFEVIGNEPIKRATLAQALGR